MDLTYMEQKNGFKVDKIEGSLSEQSYLTLMQSYINKGYNLDDIFEITKELLKNNKVKGSGCKSLLDFYVERIDNIGQSVKYDSKNMDSIQSRKYGLKDWHKLKTSEDQFEILAQLAITDKNITKDIVEKIAYIYACADSDLSRICKWEKYLENHELSQYKQLFYAKIITNRARALIDNNDMFDSYLSSSGIFIDYPAFYCFFDQIVPQIDKYYKNENFYDCLLKHYIGKALLYKSEEKSKKEINEISNEIYELFKEFEAFKGAKQYGAIDVIEDESNDRTELYTKSFYKNLFEFYMIKMHNVDKAFEIGEYVVWDLNMDMGPDFYSELGTIYINLINKHEDLNGETLSPDKKQEYFQKIIELNEKINENYTLPPEDYKKINLFENLHEKLIKLYFHERKFVNIVDASLKCLSKYDKDTANITDIAVNAYIMSRKNNCNSSACDKILENLTSDKISKFYKKVALHYAHQEQYEEASLCCQIAINNSCLNDIDKNEFEKLREEFLA